MNARSMTIPQFGMIVIGVALTWDAAFTLNEKVFVGLQHSIRANWIFLPAAIRLLAVLLFGETGALGLALGAFLTLPNGLNNDVAFNVALAMTSGIAPLAAVMVCRKFMHIARDLGGLRAWHIVVLSIASAAANAIILNSYLAAIGRLHGDVEQIATVFVGDMLGTAIVLFLLSSLLAFALPRSSKVYILWV